MDMTGELTDRYFVAATGDTRIAVTIGRNEHTAKLERINHFLVDDPDGERIMAFGLTKPLKVGNTYNGEGVLKFVMSECHTTDYDNFELMVPDYYLYFPDDRGKVPDTGNVERKGWI